MKKLVNKGFIKIRDKIFSVSYKTMLEFSYFAKSATEPLENLHIPGAGAIASRANKSIKETHKYWQNNPERLIKTRYYLKNVVLGDNFLEEKKLSKDMTRKELENPKFALGKKLPEILSKVSPVRKELLPKEIEHGKDIPETIYGYLIALGIGGEVYSTHMDIFSDVTNVPKQKITRADLNISYIMAPISAVQISPWFLPFTDGNPGQAYSIALGVKYAETLAREAIYRFVDKKYVISPTKALTFSTMPIFIPATIHKIGSIISNYINKEKQIVEEHNEPGKLEKIVAFAKETKDIYHNVIEFKKANKSTFF